MTTLQAVADRTIDAAKSARGRAGSILDGARRFAEEFAENAESRLMSRVEGARLGLGGRIRR